MAGRPKSVREFVRILVAAFVAGMVSGLAGRYLDVKSPYLIGTINALCMIIVFMILPWRKKPGAGGDSEPDTDDTNRYGPQRDTVGQRQHQRD